MTTDEREQLWRAIGKEFPEPYPRNYVTMSRSYGGHQYQFGTVRGKTKPDIHYEWLMHDDTLDVAVHFEKSKAEKNKKDMEAVLAASPGLANDLEHDFFSGPFGPTEVWRQLGYKIALEGLRPDEVKEEAIKVMRHLLKATKPSVEARL